MMRSMTQEEQDELLSRAGDYDASQMSNPFEESSDLVVPLPEISPGSSSGPSPELDNAFAEKLRRVQTEKPRTQEPEEVAGLTPEQKKQVYTHVASKFGQPESADDSELIQKILHPPPVDTSEMDDMDMWAGLIEAGKKAGGIDTRKGGGVQNYMRERAEKMRQGALSERDKQIQAAKDYVAQKFDRQKYADSQKSNQEKQKLDERRVSLDEKQLGEVTRHNMANEAQTKHNSQLEYNAKLRELAERASRGGGRGGGDSSGEAKPPELIAPDWYSEGKIPISDKEKQDFRVAVASHGDLNEGIKKLRALHGAKGTEYGGDYAAQMNSIAENMKDQMKELAKMGVLSESDATRLEAQIPNPASLGANFEALIGNDTTDARLNELQASIDRKLAQHARSKGLVFGQQKQGAQQAQTATNEEKTINGKRYKKINGKWNEV